MEHVIQVILCQPAGSPIEKSLSTQGYDDPLDIVNMEPDDLDALGFTEIVKGDDDKEHAVFVPLQCGHIGKLQQFKYYIEYLQANDHPVRSSQDWLSLDQDGFDDFHISSNSKCYEH